jgi:hypothetical protein
LARGVVPAAAAAFHAVGVKLRIAGKIAVVAPYRKHEALLYGVHFNERVNAFVVLPQAVGRNHGFPAQRTACPVLLQTVHHAVHVNGVPARRHVRGFDRMEQILQTNGAVGVELLGLAAVV